MLWNTCQVMWSHIPFSLILWQCFNNKVVIFNKWVFIYFIIIFFLVFFRSVWQNYFTDTRGSSLIVIICSQCFSTVFKCLSSQFLFKRKVEFVGWLLNFEHFVEVILKLCRIHKLFTTLDKSFMQFSVQIIIQNDKLMVFFEHSIDKCRQNILGYYLFSFLSINSQFRNFWVDLCLAFLDKFLNCLYFLLHFIFDRS